MNLEERHTQIDTAKRMADAATAFLASLRPDQAAMAQLAFDDENARRDWHYIPRDRLGLALKDMEAHQRDKAFALLDTGLSEQARARVSTIISLEPILAEVEGPRRRFPRDPDCMISSSLAPPAERRRGVGVLKAITFRSTYTIVNGTLVAPTPIFLGSNPAQVRHGEHEGLRALKEEEDLARDLLASLDGEQKRVAIVSSKAPDDILTRNVPRVNEEVQIDGLQLKDMTAAQREVRHRATRCVCHPPAPTALPRPQRANLVSLDTAAFAWAGGVQRGEGHYYRVLGATFLAEYDCTQNQANHIHAVVARP